MGRYVICLLAFLTIACCLALQPAEATDDNGIRIGFGYVVAPSSNRNLRGTHSLSWKTSFSKFVSIQNLLQIGGNGKTDIGMGTRFLYAADLDSRSQFYFGWGVNHTGPRFEGIVGFEYFFADSADLGYIFEVGVSRLKSEVEDSDNKLGTRLLFGFHSYF
ncbi:hypothetical protein F4009_11495 [Candidatus Poribacteria bacterium]|nr:hypothetical protein [Candidatus Poribacteria bacterium]MYA69612.1 hypothetical protein [Candidatus Poribacteria bacterium]MYH80163.1 hypothetical protein [Candidatus Poribacteria bacterium]MYK94597.1 hypothetical protein [Candidatus Poribacteria bacterium]